MNKRTEKDITSIEMILDRFESKSAVLISGEKECIVPAQFLPREAKEGEVLIITFATDKAEKKRREMKAKEILNEILNI